MSGTLEHVFQVAKSDGADPTQVQPSNWNDFHKFVGGNNGAILLRDTSDATYGASWLSSVAKGVLAAQGAGSLPAYTASPDLDTIRIVSVAGTDPPSPADRDAWITVTGVTPSQVMALKVKWGGVVYTLATRTD